MLRIFGLKIFTGKIFDIFNIFAQNIDCGYTLELSQRGGSNEYTLFILNDTSNATDRVFAMISKLLKVFKRKSQGR